MLFPSSQANLGLSAGCFDIACFQFLYIQGNHLQKVLVWKKLLICKSLMCSKNRIGPKTVPCGAPESTVTRADCIPSTTTRCFRKLEIHVQILSNRRR